MRVWVIERSKDGGVTWKPLYGRCYYVHGERACTQVNKMNIGAQRAGGSKFARMSYRAVPYDRA